MTTRASELAAMARAWIEGDPDPATRAELTELVDANDVAALQARLTPLTFGTAGLRAAVGAGSGRMNVAVVSRAAFGIACYLLDQEGATESPIVIGFDARPTSRSFAEVSAGVFLAAGFRVVAFAKPVATPICAYLGRKLAASCTIVVTASHNPSTDNGYKVYGADAVQIASPIDVAMAQRIAEAPLARLVPCRSVNFDGELPEGLTLAGAADMADYFAAVSAAIPATRATRLLRIVHSALHGVGTAPMLRTLGEAGFVQVHSVAAQAEPDGAFPTTPFPNPEEPGVMDLPLAEGERHRADLVLVNDPDADRLAAAARLDGTLTVLDGNQVGVLLADYALSRAPKQPPPLVLSSVVSSPLVALLAQGAGARFELAHTGFKWLWRAALALEGAHLGRFCFAYEEALGYSLSAAVRDKDGIAAGRALAEFAAQLQERGATLFDRLFEIYAERGMWLSSARNVEASAAASAGQIAERVDLLAAQPNLSIGPERVIRVVDYRKDASARPSWLGAAALWAFELEAGGRLLVRPSGTEPKFKLYGHLPGVVGERRHFARDMGETRARIAQLLEALGHALQS